MINVIFVYFLCLALALTSPLCLFLLLYPSIPSFCGQICDTTIYKFDMPPPPSTVGALDPDAVIETSKIVLNDSDIGHETQGESTVGLPYHKRMGELCVYSACSPESMLLFIIIFSHTIVRNSDHQLQR